MEKIIKFGGIEIQKQKFHQILNILLATKMLQKPLHIFVSKMSAYRKDFDETEYISI